MSIRISKHKIESYDFEETDSDVYERGDIKLVFDDNICVEVWILNAQFQHVNDYRDLEKLIKMYEG